MPEAAVSGRPDDEADLADDIDPTTLVDPLKQGTISQLLMWWMTGLIMKGFSRKGDIPKQDIPALPSAYSMHTVAPRARDAWGDEVQRAKKEDRKPDFLRVMWRMWGGLVKRGLAWAVLSGLSASVAKPVLLLKLIDAVEASDESWVLIVYISGLCLSLFLEGLAIANARHWITDHFGAAYIATTASLLQTKTLSMPSGVAGSGGQEKALLGSDCLKTHESLKHLVLLPIGTSTLLSGVIVLFVLSGWVCLFGIGLAATITFFSVRLNGRIKALEHSSLGAAEERIGITTQIIESIKAIKYSAWEENFLDLVTKAREVEVGFIKNHRALSMTTIQIGRSIPILAACATFVGLSVVGKDLRSGTVFAALTVFQSLRLALTIVPVGYSMFQTFLATIDRFSVYLTRTEYNEFKDCKSKDVPLSITHGKFSWHAAGIVPLQVPSLEVRRGLLTAVVGKVGSGKSSIISASLGDMVVEEGEVAITRSVGYVPQKAFVTCGSVQENILMGREFKQDVFDWTLRASALFDDLKQLPAGVETAIGERGITLSGGQQQRLSIARALYGEPELIILDDPLSAVDAAVAVKIFEGLKGFVKRGEGKAVLLSINQPHFLKECDHLVLMESSKVMSQGNYTHLMDTEEYFRDYIKQSTLSLEAPVVERQQSHTPADVDVSMTPPQRGSLCQIPALTEHALTDPELQTAVSPVSSHVCTPASVPAIEPEQVVVGGFALDNAGVPEPQKSAPAPQTGKTLFRTETKNKGDVNASVYMTYLRSMGWGNVCVGATLCFMAYCFMGFGDRWLALWIKKQNDYREEEEAEGFAEENRTLEFPKLELYAPVYASSCVLMVVFMVLSMLVNTRGSVRASKNLHHQILTRLLHAPMSWYQETPSGRILSRLSTDLSIVDNSLSQFYEHALNFFFTILALSAILVIVLPPVAIVLVVAGAFYVLQVKSVDRTNRDIKRLANVSSGPVLTSLSEMVQGQGRTLLRTMDFADFTETNFAGHIDRMNRYYFLSAVVVAWQSLWCYILSVVLCAAAAVYMVWSPQKRSSSEMGLALTYCFLFPYFLLFFSLTFSLFRLQITSLERLLQYNSDDVDVEPAWHTDNDPPATWPEKGAVVFENTSLVYRPGLPPALKEVDLDIKGGERLGIVGRTGAGKSSLLVLLFRLVDAAGGKVLVDGIDIKQVGLQSLRKRLAIIPQEPLLMQGTLRTNLDPFNEYPDDRVRTVLEKVGMGEVPLDTPIGNQAESLSSGQRQLVSIARSLLRDVRIVVLDEPTSSIDPVTDAVVQRVIRSEFKDCTVITIAHRLNTIIDSDRIIVMSAGQVAEIGPAKELLRNPQSHLTKMVASLDRNGAITD